MKQSLALLTLLLCHNACSDETATGPVQLNNDGGLRVLLQKSPEVVLDGLSFRVKVGSAWVKRADFALPSLQASGDEVVATYSSGPPAGPQEVILRFFLPPAGAGPFRIRVTVKAPANAALDLSAFELMVPAGGLRLAGLDRELIFLQNGYQSWSFTGVFRLQAPFSSPAAADEAAAFKAGAGDTIFEKKGVGWWFGLLAPSAAGPHLALGAATSRRQRTAILPSMPAATKAGLAVRLGTTMGESLNIPAGSSTHLEDLVLVVGAKPQQALAAYALEVARHTTPLRQEKVADPTGWWSWNIFFGKITEKQVLDHAALLRDKLKSKGFGFLELDDGYELRWGDWETLDKARFPSGLSPLVKQITGMGLNMGLWLAPFLVDEKSSLVAQHPEWFVKSGDGKPLKHSQSGVAAVMQVLDPTHPGAAKHLKDLFARLAGYGLSLFKLDFLYAGALAGIRHQRGVTGIEALRLGLDLIRQAAPGAHINLCGMPILPAVGRGHSLRYGSDIAFSGFQPGFVITAHEARNVMLRSFMDPLIRNDPDQALVRSPATVDEARAAATLAAMTGFYSSGDDLRTLSADRMEILTNPDLLAMARQGRSAISTDMVDRASGDLLQSAIVDSGLMLNDPRTIPPSRFYLPLLQKGAAYLAVFNWGRSKRTVDLDLEDLGHTAPAVRDVWDKRVISPTNGHISLSLRPHSVALLHITSGP